jgi:Glycosyl transferase family 2
MQETIIAVFCYKRASKLKTSIEALLKNPECSSMEVIFFCDGHKNEKDKQGVQDTRAYIDTISGFKHVHKHFRERNVSTGPNFQAGLTYLSDNYKQFIVVEDDLVVTPNYLKYLLDGLAYYKNQNTVFCITGYCFPLKEKDNYSYDTIIHHRFCSYGWASWSDRVKNVIWDKQGLSNLMRNSPNFKTRLNNEGYDLHRMLVKQIKGKISTWDIQMQVHVAENRLKVVYPIISKATNIGFDSESTNTFGIDYLQTPLDGGEKRSFNFSPVTVIEPSLQKQLKKPYGLPALATRKVINTFIKITSSIKGS